MGKLYPCQLRVPYELYELLTLLTRSVKPFTQDGQFRDLSLLISFATGCPAQGFCIIPVG
jgi:hypothetical protein